MKLATHNIDIKKQELQSHPLLTMNTIQSIEDLRTFMEYHVFAVWDFMSLAKSIQHDVCPSGKLWLPSKHTRNENARLMNNIIMCEESDTDLGGGSISHFDLYLQAMKEIGANTDPILGFLESVERYGIEYALNLKFPPKCCIDFVETTFEFINDLPHVTAAAFTYGRETIIPQMFKSILNQLNISHTDAPKFHYYLERHIEVDEEDHGPAALKLVESLCDNDPLQFIEAEHAAIKAIEARIKFWNSVEDAILQNDSFDSATI